MLKAKWTCLLGVLLLGTLVFSCSDDVDFSQANDLSVTPTIASSIFYFESTEEVINLTGAVGANFYTVNYEFDAFEEAFVADNILEGSITYQVENTTSKTLSILVEFLDANGAVLDFEIFTISPYPAPIDTIIVNYGIAGGKPLDIVRNTSAIRVTGTNLGDATSTSAATDPKIILRSSAEFTLRLL